MTQRQVDWCDLSCIDSHSFVHCPPLLSFVCLRLTILPPWDECPNYKVIEFFNGLRYIWKHAWDLGPTVFANEQTCSMQWQSIYNTHCGKFKRIGDGIQTDAIADNGYTIDFYFCNEPVTKIWISAGLSPMHAWLLHMFEKFPDLYPQVNMDNSFNSVQFTIAGAYCKTKELTQGVLRKNGHGLQTSSILNITQWTRV